MKRRKKPNKGDYQYLLDKVKTHSHNVNFPSIENNQDFKLLDYNTCFTIEELNNHLFINNILYKNTEHNKELNRQIKCIKVLLKPNKKQISIFNRWFNAFILMYNKTIHFIKSRRFSGDDTILNWKILRTTYLKDARDKIIESSGLKDNPKTRIKAHILDEAIKTACAKYKTCLTLYKSGYIKHFKINYWKTNRISRMIILESSFITKKGLLHNVLGNLKGVRDGREYDLSTIDSTTTLVYNKNDKTYNLYIPVRTVIENYNNRSFISLDPGVRTFLTGVSNDKCIKIGDGLNNKIRGLLDRKDKTLSNTSVPSKKKRIIELRINRKIRNITSELHWKTIDYLTKNFKTIFIGDLSSKNISLNESSSLDCMTKRISYSLGFYKFRTRLEYKAGIRGCRVVLVDECYTSKTCSCCGVLNKSLGGNKIFKCNDCKHIIDRDLNGAINILLKCL